MDGNFTKKNNLSILNLSPGGFGAEPGQVQHGSGEGSGEAARSSQWPGHPEDSRRRSGRLWCKAKSGSTDRRRFRRSFGAKPSQVQWVPEKAWEALVHSQVRFNRVLAKVPEKVWEALVPEKVPEKVWEALVQSQVRFNRVLQYIPEKVLGSRGA